MIQVNKKWNTSWISIITSKGSSALHFSPICLLFGLCQNRSLVSPQKEKIEKWFYKSLYKCVTNCLARNSCVESRKRSTCWISVGCLKTWALRYCCLSFGFSHVWNGFENGGLSEICLIYKDFWNSDLFPSLRCWRCWSERKILFFLLNLNFTSDCEDLTVFRWRRSHIIYPSGASGPVNCFGHSRPLVA
jgi:hypothetical protein